MAICLSGSRPSGAAPEYPNTGQLVLSPYRRETSFPTTNTLIPADGRKLSVSQNAALYSLYGTLFGGDGIRTFGIPKPTPPAPGTYWYVVLNGQYPQFP
jgi:hypothetical protein